MIIEASIMWMQTLIVKYKSWVITIKRVPMLVEIWM